MSYLFKRGRRFYLKYSVAGKQKEIALRTDSRQVAKERQRKFDSSLVSGHDNPLPTRTPDGDVLAKYAQHIRAIKTPKSAQTDIYYLREAFGPCCEELAINSRRPSAKARKRKRSKIDKRRTLPTLDVGYLEDLTVAQVAALIDYKVRDQGLAPKTANHFRSIIRRLINWAMESQGVRMPGGINPAAKVKAYKEPAPEIRYLTLEQIDEQLHALRFKPQLQTMVAVLIYAGLRREEVLWLTTDDIDLTPGVASGGASGGVIRIHAKTIGGEFWQPKTKRNRAIPISRALRPYLERFTPPATVSPDTDAQFRGWYFPSPQGTRYDPDNFSERELRHANQEAGLVWTCLDFRHTFGSQLAQRGRSLYKIATLMGNSPEICRRHYAQLIPESLAADVEFTSSETNHTGTKYAG